MNQLNENGTFGCSLDCNVKLGLRVKWVRRLFSVSPLAEGLPPCDRNVAINRGYLWLLVVES